MANIWNHICIYLWKYIRKSEEVSMFSKFSPLSQRNCLQTRFAQYCEPTGSYADCPEFTMFTKDSSGEPASASIVLGLKASASTLGST